MNIRDTLLPLSQILEDGLIFRRAAFMFGIWMTWDAWTWTKAMVQQPMPWEYAAGFTAGVFAAALALVKIYSDYRKSE